MSAAAKYTPENGLYYVMWTRRDGRVVEDQVCATMDVARSCMDAEPPPSATFVEVWHRGKQVGGKPLGWRPRAKLNLPGKPAFRDH